MNEWYSKDNVELEIPVSYEAPNDESLQAIAETQEMIKSGCGTVYTSGQDLLKAALSCDSAS